jgi:cysteinyl-tRNA synthetase
MIGIKMKLFNTLNRKKEDFKPLGDRKVSLYACGPTVYDEAHIGNLRTYIFEDTLKRALLMEGFSVNHVMNITDVDDKIIKKSQAKKEEFNKIIKKYEELFLKDLDKLNIIKPNVVTRATEYIDKMVVFIKDLLDKGYAYKAPDGSIYFSIDKFVDYGRLSRLDKTGIKAGARVKQDEYEKENPADFALWKTWDESDGEIYWETSLGKGRPGWHIECSTMAGDVLGDTIDIHAGAVDLIFPHHENEIAQSEARSGKKFVNFWVHGEHLLVDGKKMSKSLDNFYTLRDIKDREFEPLDFRYLVLGAHYRSKLNFTWDGLTAAKNSRSRLNRLVSEMEGFEERTVSEVYKKQFINRIEDDLDTPGGLAVLWEMLRDEKITKKEKYGTTLFFDQTLGLNLGEVENIEIPEEIKQIAEKRKEARINKNFKASDELRDDLKKKGWLVEDLEGNNYKLNKCPK